MRDELILGVLDTGDEDRLRFIGPVKEMFMQRSASSLF
jgi:hypothetical protein